ncbi:MAG: soluble lytic murein transglycosylase [Alphaproteobacteria bacterium]
MHKSTKNRIGAMLAAAAVFTAAGSLLAVAEDTAALSDRAIPRIQKLPEPLAAADVNRYRQIFDRQKNGQWKRADAVIKRLDSKILLGHILAQRYLHPTRYRSRYGELAAWMKDYADHPDAKRIYKLAIRRKPRRARMPARPQLPKRETFTESGNGGIERVNRSGVRYSKAARRLHASIRRMVRRVRLTSAEKLANSVAMRRLGRIHQGIAEARIAAGWFYHGSDKKAYQMGSRAARKAGAHAPFGHWYAGLAAFRMGRYREAADQFQAMAAIGGQSRWPRSAAAFWAARAGLRAGRPDEMARWLRLAASYPRTFYGILGRRMLGAESPFTWQEPSIASGSIAAALSTPRAQRALALLQTGERNRASQELRSLAAASQIDTRIALLVIAERNGMPSVALRTASTLLAENSTPIERALYPVPLWKPRNGFAVDRALIFAVMRQESAFNPRAKSHAGARGLMQLMPGTAGYMANRRFRGRGRAELFDPSLNLSLGQKYLRYLLQHEQVQGDLFLMAAAYNGGPGNLAKWQRRIGRKTNDPLLVIESLPSRETRDFIERVISNLWLYRERFGQPAPSLDAIASGERPLYHGQDSALIATTASERAKNGGN